MGVCAGVSLSVDSENSTGTWSYRSDSQCTKRSNRGTFCISDRGHSHRSALGEDIELNPGLTNEDLIWNARSDIPFIMVDNPTANRVFVDRLVGLPEDRLCIEQDGRFGVDGIFCGELRALGANRMVLRTAAVCEFGLGSTFFAPTLLRAGLLTDQFYPTSTVVRRIWSGEMTILAPQSVRLRKESPEQSVESSEKLRPEMRL